MKSHVIKHKLLLLCRELFAPGLDSHLDVFTKDEKKKNMGQGTVTWPVFLFEKKDPFRDYA